MTTRNSPTELGVRDGQRWRKLQPKPLRQTDGLRAANAAQERFYVHMCDHSLRALDSVEYGRAFLDAALRESTWDDEDWKPEIGSVWEVPYVVKTQLRLRVASIQPEVDPSYNIELEVVAVLPSPIPGGYQVGDRFFVERQWFTVRKPRSVS